MHRFKNILFVTNPGIGMTPALQRAAELAKANGGRLTVAQILEPHPEAWAGDLRMEVSGLVSRIEEEHESELASLADALEGVGARPETRLLTGKAFLAVIREVLDRGHDLVMKVAEGASSGFRSRLFGSTDQHLMRKCPCPVWLFSPQQDEKFRSVLASVDVGTEGNRELRERILQLASSLAVREGAEFHVVHAWALYGESILRSPARGVSKELLDQLLDEEKSERARRLQELVDAEAVPGSDANLHLVKAEAAQGIQDVAREVRADVVVMGTVSRAGVRGLLIGNTAETVLSHLDCSVMTVKPEGFQSPVAGEDAR